MAPRAPSARLLRFLRSQVETSCFFTSNPPSSRLAASSSPLRRAPSSRLFTSTCRRPAAVVVESSLLPLDALVLRTLAPKKPRPLRLPALYAPNIIPYLHTAYPRSASSESRPWIKRLSFLKLGGGKNEDDAAVLPTFLSDPGGGANVGRTTAAKASDGLKLRCTEFDGDGNVTLVHGEFKKSELIAMYGLLPRDLRKIDSSTLPHILIRPSAILINLLHLRVLIKYNRVLVFDVYGSTDSYTQSLFMYDLEGKLRQKEMSRQAGGLPYEFRALEAVLISVTGGLEGEFETVREPVVRVLRELEEDIDRDKLRHLLIYSKKLGTFEQKARLVRDSINDLLETDEDLASMYLTERFQGISREDEDHTEVEMLLESYHKLCDEIVQVSGNLVSNIRNTEEIVKAILDANRNSLMLLDLKFSIGTLGIGSGAFIAALYGMNLKNFVEESDLGFVGVSAWSFVFAAIVCAYGLVKLRKVQRVSMWGEEGRRSRGSWGTIDPLPALSGESREERLRRLKEFREEVAKGEARERVLGGEGGEVVGLVKR